MFIDIIDSIAACLDLESAKKINSLPLEEKIVHAIAELTHTMNQNDLSDTVKLMELSLLRYFVAHLQMKARTVLRTPRSADPPPAAAS